jgi:hypothetical protein
MSYRKVFRMVPCVVAWLALLAMAVPAIPAFAYTYAGMEFAVPPGWEVSSGDGSLFLARRGLKPGQVVLAALPSDIPLQNMTEQFDRAVRVAQSLGVAGKAGKVSATRLVQGHDMLRQVVSVRREGVGTMYLVVFATNAGNRFRSMVLTANSFELLTQHSDTVEAFFTSIKYVRPTSLPAPAEIVQAGSTAPVYVDAASRRDGEKNLNPLPPGRARLDGLYVTQDSGGTVGPGGSFYATTTFRFYYFMPNGYTYMGPKEAGLENIRCSKPTVNKYGMPVCSTYSADGDTIRIGLQNPTRLRRKGQDLRIGDYDFALVPKANNLRLSGAYESYLGGSVAQSNLGFSFARDGRFTTSNFTGIAVDTDPANSGMSGGARVSVAGSSQSDAQGTYRINGYTLDLTYDSGRKVRAFFAPVAGMEVLRIGSRVYSRQ